MSRVSAQTMNQVARELLKAHTGYEWDRVPQDVREEYEKLAEAAVVSCRLPIEVEVRKRLLSDEGLAAAQRQIDEELPEGFEWPDDDTESGVVFASALMAAFADTPGTITA